MLTLMLLACTLVTQEELAQALDPDGDGVDAPDDCDDTDPNIGIFHWYADTDGDGYGDPAALSTECDAPLGYVENDGDCDDGDPSIFPGGEEWCDGADGDCDGAIDETPEDPELFFLDADGDGYGLEDETAAACAPPEGYAEAAGDCDDSAPSAHPGATPICGDGLDNDCDGLGDCGLALEGTAQTGEEAARVDGDERTPLHGAVVGGQDLTGDGVPDVVVGSVEGDGVDRGTGLALLYSGPLSGTLAADDAAFRLVGQVADDATGAALAIADLDDSGTANLIVSEPGEYQDQGILYITLGPITEDMALGVSANAMYVSGISVGDRLGEGLRTADLNGDSAADLIVGAPGVDDRIFSVGNNSGRLYIAPGPLPRENARIDNIATSIITFPGVTDLNLGAHIDVAPDVDGDGHPDLMLGLPELRISSSQTNIQGAAYLLTDDFNGEAELTDVARVGVFHFGTEDVGFGETAVGVGDCDGDGYAEVLVGAPGWDEGANRDAGKAWLLDGASIRAENGESLEPDDHAVAIFFGGDDTWALAASAEGPGDLTGDGHAELLLGVPGYTPSNRDIGAAALFTGPFEGSYEVDDAHWVFEGTIGGTELGGAVTTVGDLNGLGLPELAIAATADDGSIYLLPTDGL